MRKANWALCALATGAALFSYRSADAIPFRPSPIFLQAQGCRVNGTVDFGCFQKNAVRFEQFVLKDDAPWLQKVIVAESLVKYYDASHVSSARGSEVRAKAKIYEWPRQRWTRTNLVKLMIAKMKPTLTAASKYDIASRKHSSR